MDKMQPEEFLRHQFRQKIDENKKLSAQSVIFKRQTEEYAVTLWRQSVHRCDEAIRQAIAHAKLSMNKGAK